jgi:antitoxin (DNA-binding transcriptional repressor) of toxin-antitoxin stability system
MDMRAVGLKMLKNKLSEYVRLAANGERILVTDHDRVVAELIAPETHRSEYVHDALLAEAVRAGIVTPPLSRSTEPPPRKPVMSTEELMRQLDESRADRWSI